MSLFDSVEDARGILTEYLDAHQESRKGSVALQAMQAACDMLRAVAAYESSPWPIVSHVDCPKGAKHLKKVMTPSEHAAWLALVKQVSRAQRTAQRHNATAIRTTPALLHNVE